DGCVTFNVTIPDVSKPASACVTEGTTLPQFPDMFAPAQGNHSGNPNYTVNGRQACTTDLMSGDLWVIDFGNECKGCFVPNPHMSVNKTAFPSYQVTWGVDKVVDQDLVKTASDGVVNYTVKFTHDAGTNWSAAGTITVLNDGNVDLTGVVLTDTLANCTIG